MFQSFIAALRVITQVPSPFHLTLSTENVKRKCICHCLVPSHIRMERVTPVVLAVQICWIGLVLNRRGKINDVIKISLCLDPGIHRLPRRLLVRTRITTSSKRRDRPANGDQSSLLRIGDDGLVRIDELVGNVAVVTDVIHAFEYHYILYTWLIEGITLVAGHSTRAETLTEDAVSARSLVIHGDVCVVGRLQTSEEEVGPAVVLVVVGPAAVSYRVADNDKGVGG
jgi:hypothetical protein